MKQTRNHRALAEALMAVPVFLAILLCGLQYAYYKIFSGFSFYDDEGTLMLRVRAFIDHPASYDSLAGMYGPFYYLHKYAIHSVLHAPVSHDFTRLTTLAFWLMIAGAGALFVHRLSRSLVLAAVTLMQLLLHLTGLAYEPGHPQEVSLLLIVGALLLSAFVNERRSGLWIMAGLGAAVGALLLVKVNLGVYLGVPLMLAVLWALPGRPLVHGLTGVAVAGALVLPAAIMWRHLGTAWGRHYCSLVTLMIAAGLAASWRDRNSGALRWGHVAAAAVGATLTIGGVCAIIVAWGAAPSAIANSVAGRAAALPLSFVIPSSVSRTVVAVATVSLAIAVCYALAPQTWRRHEMATIVLSAAKLAYGMYALYALNYYAPLVLFQAIPLPFVWLVVARAETDDQPMLEARFPRVFLCLMATFQALQAYPVRGSQALWSVILVAPVAAICAGDALRTLVDIGAHHLQRYPSWRTPPWCKPLFTVLVLGCFLAGYYERADVAAVRATYEQETPLTLPGAARVRLPPLALESIRWAVVTLKANCDGFVGMPGFASFYFWTGMPPPAVMNNAWILNLDDTAQRAIVKKMQTYQRPCVLYDARAVAFWTKGRSLDRGKPLVRYIQTEYEPRQAFGHYALLQLKRVRPHGATNRRVPVPGMPRSSRSRSQSASPAASTAE